MNSIKLIYYLNFSRKYFPRYSRLDGTLRAYRLAHDKWIEEKIKDGEKWAEEVLGLLNQARSFLDDHKIDEAWRCFHTAKRMAVNGMSSEELSDQAKELMHEIEKLKVWRREAIKSVIGYISTQSNNTLRPELLIRALTLKDEHYNNEYYKNRLTRGLYKMLFILLSLNVLAIFYFVFSCVNKGIIHDLNQVNLLIGVILFGLLGAITSSILFTRTQSKLSRISEINSNKFLVLSKIAIGVGFTIFIYILLKSDIASSIQLFNFSISKPLDYFTVAFLSGFTERLAQKAISTVLGDEEEKEEKNP